jgi:hypothetical protein
MTLNPLVINVARENLFYDWLKDRDKLGANIKYRDYQTKGNIWNIKKYANQNFGVTKLSTQ